MHPWADSCLFLLCLGVILRLESVPLRLDTFLSPLTRSLDLRTLSIHFLLEDPFTVLLSLGLVNLMAVLARVPPRNHSVDLHARLGHACA